MRRKPDLLWVLVAVFSFGMVTTGYTQSQWPQGFEAPRVEATTLSSTNPDR